MTVSEVSPSVSQLGINTTICWLLMLEIEAILLHTDTVILVASVGKPLPVRVAKYPPLSAPAAGDTVESTNGTVIGATPSANGIIPKELMVTTVAGFPAVICAVPSEFTGTVQVKAEISALVSKILHGLPSMVTVTSKSVNPCALVSLKPNETMPVAVLRES